MFHKVNFVKALPDYVLLVHFSEGVSKEYDVKPLLSKWKPFKSLEEIDGLFKLVKVDVGGYGVSWNNEIDLSCDELWENGKDLFTPFDNLIALSDATALWGLSDSALRKAISYGKLVDGVDVRKYGKQWVVSKDAMRREYGEIKAGE